jgi:organic radical activating enzyme
MIYKNSCDGIYSSLDIRFTKLCDNNCPFCIEKNGIPTKGLPNVPNLIQTTLQSGIRDVLILGGEPFYHPERLLEYVEGIREKVKTIFITTSLPKNFFDNSKTCASILYLIDGLNVSLQATNDEDNNDLLNATSKHSRLSILKSLNEKHADKIRTSINLLKGGIDSKHKLLFALDDLKEIGCKHIKINELQNSSELYVSFEKIMGKKFKSPYYHGCSEYVPDYNGMKILLKRSCFAVEPSLKASFKDLFKIIIKKFFRKKPLNTFGVIYEDGTITSKWESKKC